MQKDVHSLQITYHIVTNAAGVVTVIEALNAYSSRLLDFMSFCNCLIHEM